jgi:S-adenosylmethionine:tRNA ribosyltransferase-isomerase
MHSESFSITEDAAKKINSADRIVAVGTTTLRVLETAARTRMQDAFKISSPRIEINAQEGETDLFVYPPFQFQAVDALLTNFHLPRSTLLMLVSAFAGREFVLRAYTEAIREQYRFYSYGDCMLVL